jgi:hypothetical protein
VLSYLSLTNFRGFRDRNVLPLAPLTLLIGKNSSGKSTLVRAIAMLAASMEQNASHDSNSGAIPLPLNAGDLILASHLTELAFQSRPHSEIGLGFAFEDEARRRIETEIAIQVVTSVTAAESAYISKYEVKESGRLLTGKAGVALDRSFNRIWPVGEAPWVQPYLQSARKALSKHSHLTSHRAPIHPVYEYRAPRGDFDHDGREVPYLLRADEALMDGVRQWYAGTFGGSVLTLAAEANSFSLQVENANLRVAGQGLQQVLPVASRLIDLTLKARGSMLSIEEPELHVHPSAHGRIADLAIDAVMSGGGSQVIIETHSEELLLRIRRRVAEGVIPESLVQLVWVDSNNGVGQVIPIGLREDGSVDGWPEGVFRDSLDEVRAIARAQKS